jgi:hypothetical protein
LMRHTGRMTISNCRANARVVFALIASRSDATTMVECNSLDTRWKDREPFQRGCRRSVNHLLSFHIPQVLIPNIRCEAATAAVKPAGGRTTHRRC